MTMQLDPHTEIDRIPGMVARVRAAADSGLAKPLEWRRKQLVSMIAMRISRPYATARSDARCAEQPAVRCHFMIQRYQCALCSLRPSGRHDVSGC